MVKREKELEEISTTDKLKAFKTLKDAGYRVEMSTSGVPTVVCQNAEDIGKELNKVRKALKELRYSGSFGIRGPRKSDQMMADEAPETMQENAPEVAEESQALTA